MRQFLAAAMVCLGGIASAQDVATIPEPSSETPLVTDINEKVAAYFGNPPTLHLRNVQRLTPERADSALYCGQVLLDASKVRHREYQLFTYTRLTGTDSIRILGSNDLNGLRSGRKTIAWLKRAGCL